jgi:membrane protease subunit (stomatin/prohibitin family)
VSIPLRAYGQFGLRVVNAREFVTQIAGASGGGTRGSIVGDLASKAFVARVAPIVQGESANAVGTTANDTTRNLLESLIITCLQQAIGDKLTAEKTSIFDLPGQVLAVGKATQGLLQANYQTFGVELVNFALESINFDPQDESVKRLRSMLDEAARLDLVGEAFRRNQDFYRTERQFDVLQGAAEGGGAAGAVMGATMGIGLGFGAATPAANLAKESMAKTSGTCCRKCSASVPESSKFCPSCGEDLQAQSRKCIKCSALNPTNAKFCCNCGASVATRSCPKCAAELAPGSRFCNQCGEKT